MAAQHAYGVAQFFYEDRLCNARSYASLEKPGQFCKSFHTHGTDEQCFRKIGEGWQDHTNTLPTAFYTELRERNKV